MIINLMTINAPQGRSRLVLIFRGPLRICCDTSRGRFGLAPDAEVESVRGTAAEADQMKSAQISDKTECGMPRTLGVKQQGLEVGTECSWNMLCGQRLYVCRLRDYQSRKQSNTLNEL